LPAAAGLFCASGRRRWDRSRSLFNPGGPAMPRNGSADRAMAKTTPPSKRPVARASWWPLNSGSGDTCASSICSTQRHANCRP
jgi:hypothetical protein